MRNIFFVLVAIVFVSCSQISEDVVGNEILSIKDSLIMIQKDSVLNTDSVVNKVNELIKSTENADKKVSEIKVMKKENQCLKKELIDTKNELKEANEQIKKLDSTIKTSEKKGIIRKMIDNIKGDSAKNDTIK